MRKGHTGKLISFLIAIGIAICGSVKSLQAQQKTQRATTSGSCSPVVFGNRNVIDCGKLSAGDAAMLAEILNDARASSKSLAEIRELIEKALDPSRDTVTYFPDGESLTSNQNAGFNSKMAIGERHVYEQFTQLDKDQNWPALLALVVSEKAKVPTWFTVDFFSSEAYLHNCEVDKAMEFLDTFIREVANSPNYGDMLKGAQQIRVNLETDKDAIRRNCSVHGQPFNR